ncbi:hypothetical protein TRVL_08518 [Trypanosoma vivax]|nr:hypothetical protein TRVL_08518 [Trypanosoma vivax]
MPVFTPSIWQALRALVIVEGRKRNQVANDYKHSHGRCSITSPSFMEGRIHNCHQRRHGKRQFTVHQPPASHSTCISAQMQAFAGFFKQLGVYFTIILTKHGIFRVCGAIIITALATTTVLTTPFIAVAFEASQTAF